MNRLSHRFLGTAMFSLVFLAAIASCSLTAAQGIQYAPDPNADANMTLLLKDWAPVPMLHAAKHEVQRAKFYVIDVHNHVNDPSGNHGAEVPAADVVKAMDAVNVKKIVILTGLWGEKLQGVLDKMVKPYPDRFMVFAQMDWSKIDDPNFSQLMVAQLDDAVKRGARGLKILKDWGLGVRDKSGKLVPIDDPRMDPVWEECGKLGIPVAIHSTDPEAFFTPTDARNERYEELKYNPSWSFYGPQFPGKQVLLDERNHVFAKHPRTTFIALHIANWPENLDAVSEWLKKYPNMYLEFGAREAELGRQPRRAYKFFTEFQDRILFGTDAEPIPAMYRNYFRWLETEDEYFPYWDYPGQGRWGIYGLGLADSVLRKVYHENAETIFSQFHGGK
ncbi:MAG TPA: amidohydrolase family protein [Candidatus Acidoferrum sp.]|nr:amidohydrolase family protein [Candidatus Acidoferrum sp.]